MLGCERNPGEAFVGAPLRALVEPSFDFLGTPAAQVRRGNLKNSPQLKGRRGQRLPETREAC